jgi:hypothetical protein
MFPSLDSSEKGDMVVINNRTLSDVMRVRDLRF